MPTSKLQRQVSNYLHENSSYLIRENYRPDWLISDRGTRLELDFYIDEIKLAIEVQGIQHYVYVEYFHKDANGFKQRLLDDRYKKDYCEHHGIRFVEIASDSEISELSKYLRKPNRVLSSQDPNFVYIKQRHPINDLVLSDYKQPRLTYPATHYSISNSKPISAQKPPLSKQAKFNMYTNRLHQWMLGDLSLDEVKDKRRFLKSAFHNFLEKYKVYAREIDMDNKFIEFLENNYPDERYKDGFNNLKTFFTELKTKSLQTVQQTDLGTS